MLARTTPQFKITFECAASIRTLSDVLADMLDACDIAVHKTDAFTGIRVEAMDSKQISLVSADLHADVELEEGVTTTSFCINTKTLKTCVKSAPHHYAISIESLENSSHIKLTAYESLSNSSITRFTLPTLVSEQETFKLAKRSYSYEIDMETATFKGIVRMCTDLKGENISIRVRQPKKDLASEPKRQKCDAASSSCTVLSIQSHGGNAEQIEHTFYSQSAASEGDQGVCISTMSGAEGLGFGNAVNDDDLDTKYDEMFAANQLATFLKSIDRQSITLRLEKDAPLVINHLLSGGESFVCLVLAQKIKEDDGEEENHE